LTGPGLFNWDFSLHKENRIAALGEAGNLEFRAEFFNVFNHPNFFLPNPAINGVVNPSQPTANPAAISQARDGRDIQLALKLNF
jgi:hypothetical protein